MGLYDLNPDEWYPFYHLTPVKRSTPLRHKVELPDDVVRRYRAAVKALEKVQDEIDALRRAANGEDADLLYAEQYANSDHESVTSNGPRSAFYVPEAWTRHDDRPNGGTEHTAVPVIIDPELAALGEARVNAYGPPRTIVLREWSEQVFLHECLHVLLDGRVPTSHGDPHGHDTISRAEIALWEAGWRLTASTTDPSEGEPRGE